MYPELHPHQYCIYGLTRSQVVTKQISVCVLGVHKTTYSMSVNYTEVVHSHTLSMFVFS